MRSPFVHRALGAVAALALVVSFAHAQNPSTPASGVSQQGVGNAQLSLPYGAKDDKAVSRWTPPASVGRQLTLNDLMSWKQIRTPQISNDGKWFAYVLAPNEGDAEVVIRPTTAGAKELRFAIGEQPAPTGGQGGGQNVAAAATLSISGNGRWAAFLVYPSANTPRRGRGA